MTARSTARAGHVFERVAKDKGVDVSHREFTTNRATDFNAILTRSAR